ncbi:MAG: metallophosphoesterase [Sarcina sp.]
MSTYVCSDIHGDYKGLLSILKDINFGKNDRLIINGDLIDREHESAQLMEFVLDNENVELLLGNHELLFIKGFEIFPELYKGKAYSSRAKKFEETYLHYVNGGKTTMDSLRRYYKYNIHDRDLAYEFYTYIKNIKLYKVINGITISHTGKYDIDNIEDSVWDRREWIFAMTEARDIVGKNIIGHTSVGVRYLIIEEGNKEEFGFIIENINGDFILNLDGSDRRFIPIYDVDNHIIYFKKNYIHNIFFVVNLKTKNVEIMRCI